MKSNQATHFNQIKFGWSDNANTDIPKMDTDEDDSYQDYPLPPNAGSMRSNILKTSHQISVHHVSYDYHAGVAGDQFNLGRLAGEFDSNTLMIGAVFGQQIIQQELYPEARLHYGEELMLFHHADRFDNDAFHDSAHSFDSVYISLPIHSLELLIGADTTDFLLECLGVASAPAVAAHPVPLRISRILKTAVSHNLQGRMKKLYAQTKVLEYLCELVEYLEQNQGQLPLYKDIDSIIDDLHDTLLSLQGKVPAMTELAERTGINAQTLNEAFRKRYGLTIPRFIHQKRMEEAHTTIQESDIPLKALSSQLGYSHVNHFSAAFKKVFNYSPVSLRRK